MKVKGFTLIELLAVIVILAIIALIAVPIILNIIGSSKKSAVLRSGELYLKAVETAIARENLNNQFNPTTCIIENDGNLTCDEDKTLTIQVNGSKPTSGTITLEKGKIKQVEDMILDGFELEKKPGERLKIKGTSNVPSTPVEPENPKVELKPTNSYLMSGYNLSDKLDEFVEKSKVEIITVTAATSVPQNVIGSLDVSENQDGNIMAWYLDSDNNGKYELYIGGNGGVKANPTSNYLFQFFSNVLTIDLSYLDTSDIKNVDSMFEECNELTNIIGLEKFNTSQVTSMMMMFNGCFKLTNLNLSSFDTNNATSMLLMFGYCSNLENIDFSKASFNTVTDYFDEMDSAGIFSGCSKLKTIIVKDAEAQTWINARLSEVGITGVAVTIA